MQLVLTDDQKALAESAERLMRERSPLARIRQLRDDADKLGYSASIWEAMAELGWQAIPFPEAYGGLDMGLAEVVIVTEAMGRSLAPEPYLSSVMMGGQALLLGGTEAQKEQWLPQIATGKAVVTLAYQEPKSRYDLHRIDAKAERSSNGFRLTGEKMQVLDAHVADALVVVARTNGTSPEAAGLTAFLVPKDASGLEIERQHRVDARNTGLVKLDGVSVSEDSIVGTVDGAGDLLENVVDRATVALCGEMLGGVCEAFDRTLAYLQERVQFGVPIGSFQALKHRAADVFIQRELSRTAVMVAARQLDAGDARAKTSVSMAKARLNDAYRLTANEAIQFHGGIGMTDEHDIGFFLKRAHVAELTFGDSAFHRSRFAALTGF